MGRKGGIGNVKSVGGKSGSPVTANMKKRRSKFDHMANSMVKMMAGKRVWCVRMNVDVGLLIRFIPTRIIRRQ